MADKASAGYSSQVSTAPMFQSYLSVGQHLPASPIYWGFDREGNKKDDSFELLVTQEGSGRLLNENINYVWRVFGFDNASPFSICLLLHSTLSTSLKIWIILKS